MAAVSSVEIQYTYKWTTTSKDKLFNVLSERETIYEIVSFENFKFENTSDDVNSANEKVSNIFEKMAKRSCKIVNQVQVGQSVIYCTSTI
jgi:hypothetical protein